MRKTEAGKLRQVVAKPYWREQDAAVVVEAWKSSATSQRAFSRRWGIDPKRLARWSKRLGASSRDVEFLPVRLIEAEPAEIDRESPLELLIGDGRSILVREGFSEDTLRRLLVVLGGGAC